jgi:hypothetical protein
MLILLLT